MKYLFIFHLLLGKSEEVDTSENEVLKTLKQLSIMF